MDARKTTWRSILPWAYSTNRWANDRSAFDPSPKVYRRLYLTSASLSLAGSLTLAHFLLAISISRDPIFAFIKEPPSCLLNDPAPPVFQLTIAIYKVFPIHCWHEKVIHDCVSPTLLVLSFLKHSLSSHDLPFQRLGHCRGRTSTQPFQRWRHNHLFMYFLFFVLDPAILLR